MAALNDKQLRLVDEPNFAVVATVDENGAPQTSVVWVDIDGEQIVFNTTLVRAKAKHLAHDPRVNVIVIDRDDWHRYLEVEGTAELDETGANEHIEKLSQKYDGKPFAAPTGRVIVRVAATRIHDHQVS